MTVPSILLPVFILVLLMFFLIGWTVKERISGVRSGEVNPESVALSREGWQPKAKQVGNCLQNQFELPPLFYALVILAIMMHKADYTFVIMEWIFVLSRLGHTYVFTTSNHPGGRGGTFMVGALILFLMWVIFAIRIFAVADVRSPMTPGGRIAAAIEILDEIGTKHRPASDALKDWGLSHRFAGSKDRVAIGSFVFDALRCKASAAWIMGADTSRAILLGSLRQMRRMDVPDVMALCSGEGHAPSPLSEAEQEAIAQGTLDNAPPDVLGDFPDWLTAALGDNAVALGRALAERAPVDLRVNRLKAMRAKALAALAHLHAKPTPLSPDGIRLPFLPDGRGPTLSAEAAYVKGLVEIQDEGSQLAALLSNAGPGEQVLDLCAGGGGKTLALAALMQNKGQVYASDSDGRRLMPIYKRLERAGARNVQVRPPKRGGEDDVLADLAGRCDLVLVDAPCTGTGTWRRNPDAKWRIRPSSLEHHMTEQSEVLETAMSYLNPRGRLLYITCSLLRDENETQIERFLMRHPEFKAVPAEEMVSAAGLPQLAPFASPLGLGLRLSPLQGGTDGFYIACLKR